MDFQLHGRKQHIRALLIDRVMLQHEASELGLQAFCLSLSCAISLKMCVLSAAEADNGRMSVQEYSPGADERSVKTFHQYLQSGDFKRTRISQFKNPTFA